MIRRPPRSTLFPLHDALPIYRLGGLAAGDVGEQGLARHIQRLGRKHGRSERRSEEHTSELQSLAYLVCRLLLEKKKKRKKVDRQALQAYKNICRGNE